MYNPSLFISLFFSLKKLGTLCIWDKKSQNHTGKFYISTHFHILLDFLVRKENLMLEARGPKIRLSSQEQCLCSVLSFCLFSKYKLADLTHYPSYHKQVDFVIMGSGLILFWECQIVFLQMISKKRDSQLQEHLPSPGVGAFVPGLPPIQITLARHFPIGL